MNSPIAILPACLESTIATIRDLETKIAGWKVLLASATSAPLVEMHAIMIAAAEKQLVQFQDLAREQQAQQIEREQVELAAHHVKLNNRQQTAAVRAYAAKHGYSASTVRTTSALRYAAFAAFAVEQAQQVEREQVELRCECGELADGEMAEVVRNGRHVLVHVNGCMRDSDLLA